ncbi:hypothetical protein PCASD_26556 [Puccinia coronata f. sp. avenae]|uniref:Uncharacterized protein n=1 Tax=Puccinia coronata f. sp. avenae TaxID=200324 RepID=A0A2N5THX1_9BASI|nr:hypothetical protein PCASD_26556 [Puccinia coronata f. sp. avenae]
MALVPTKTSATKPESITLPTSLTKMDNNQLKQHITDTSVTFYGDQPKDLQVEGVASLAGGQHCFVRVGTGYGKIQISEIHTAGINRSNTAARAVLKQPCLTGGRTGTVQPKQEPTGWTDLSNRSRLVLCNRSQELIGQACPTRRQVLWSDSACPTTGRTRLFEHRSNCRVQPVNASSANSPSFLFDFSGQREGTGEHIRNQFK